MKIITKSNYALELYEERVVAENVHPILGKELVDVYNDRYWTEDSLSYLALVEDDYEPYNGYADLP